MPSLPTSKSIWSFSPQSIPGLALWLDAADTVTVTGTSPVTVWKDKSGKGNNATNSGGDGPTYANNTMTFSGLDSRLYISIPYNYAISGGTIVFVGKPLSYSVHSQWRTLIRGANSDHQVILYSTNNDIGSYSLGNGFQQYGTYTNDGSLTMLMYVNISTSSLFSASMNGDIALSSNANPTLNTADTYYGLGNIQYGSQPWGDLNEIIIYDSALSTSQRQQLEGYLAQKWLLQENLPTTHPYYATSSMQLYKRPVFQRTFQPVDIDGCVLWLDAADQRSMTFSSGTTVTQWNDKSGNGNNATANTGITWAANGIGTNLPAMTFTSDQWFLGNISITGEQLTAFCIFNMTSLGEATPYSRILSLAAPGAFDYDNVSYITIALNDEPSGQFVTWRNGENFPVYITYGANELTTTWADGSTLNMSQYGGEPYTSGSLGNFNVSSYSIGRSTYTSEGQLYGYISEIIVYNSSLSTSQRQQVESYLAWKWGLTSLIPSTHPGKLLPSFSTVFTPKSLTGLQLWLDAADSTSLSYSGSNVTAWGDKSGNGNNMNTLTGAPIGYSQTSPTTGTAINGLNTVNFLPGAGLQQATILDGVKNLYWVGRIDTTSVVEGGANAFFLLGQEYAYDWHADYPGGYYINSIYGQLGIRNATPVSQYGGGAAAAVNITFSALQFPASGSISLVSAAGITGSTLYQGICFDRIGVHCGWSGDLAEVIIFNQALSTTQHQQVEGYLAWKWGLQGNLPDTHAYKKFRP
jgi:hypothetical protein